MSSGYASRSGSRAVRQSEETMDNNDDGDDKDDTKRKSRNASEKKRRDQFNVLIHELSSMVATSNRKMDKSTVLKSTISFLKSHNDLAERSRENEIQQAFKPAFLTNEEFTHLVLEAVCGFILVFSSCGKIIYVSESITALLGHLPSDLLNLSLYELVSVHDREQLFHMFLNPNTSSKYENRETHSFLCYFKRNQVCSSEEVLYELVKFSGYFRADFDSLQIGNDNDFNTGDAVDSRLVFVGTGRLVTAQIAREIVIIENTKSEFTSRYSLHWKFIFLDHRATPIIGYMPFEILGTSGYDYYHMDDLDNVLSCHKTLMQKGEGISCYYRFLTKGQQYIWLQTRFFITYHQWTSKPEFVVCSHKVISHSNVMNYLQKESKSSSAEPSPESSQFSRQGVQQQSSPWPSVRSPGSKSSQSEAKVFSSRGVDSDTSMSVESVPPTATRNTSHMPSQAIRSRCVTTTTTVPSSKVTLLPDFIEPPVSYPLTIPLQSVTLTAPTSIVTTVTPEVAVRQPMVMNSAQSQIQDHLQKKHEQLQQLIVQQQEELRRVSEQLFMARYGLLSPLLNVNVPVPYAVPGPAPHLALPVSTTAELFVPAHHSQRPHIMIDQVNFQQAQTSGDPVPFQLTQQQAQQYLFPQSMDSPNSTDHSQ